MNRLRQSIGNGVLLFWLLPIIYFLLYGFDGFADTDQGFVPALAWRIKLGQVPYLDFVYVRPPLTPVLHAAELWVWPREFQILGMRLDFYLMMWGSVAFGLLTLRRFFDFKAWGISLWMLGVLAFLYSVHNFPAMPWHTVDGIFFGSLGIWLITHPRARWQMVLGLCALGLAGLAKQPFALMLPLGMVLVFILQPRKIALLVIAIAVGLMGVAVAGAIALLPDGFFAAMLQQTMGASSLGELLGTGVVRYVLPLGLFVLPVGLFYWWMKRRSAAEQGQWGLSWALLAAFAFFPLAHAGLAFWKMSFMSPRLGVYHALLLAGVLFAVHQWRNGERKSAAVLLMLCALSWASGLSWGYAVPVLFALPGIFGLLAIVLPHIHSRPTWLSRRSISLVAGLAFLGFFLLQLFPYRDAPRWELQSGAGEVFPELGFIRTSPENIARLEELRYLDSLHNGRYIVLPAMPAAHYFTQRTPPLGIDWEHDAEIGARQMDRIAGIMYKLYIVILVEKAREEEAYSDNVHYRSSLLKEVLLHGIKQRSGKYYDVYAPMSF